MAFMTTPVIAARVRKNRFLNRAIECFVVTPDRTTTITASQWADKTTVSDADRTGGVSTTTKSYSARHFSTSCVMLGEPIISAGEGDSGPAGITDRLGTDGMDTGKPVGGAPPSMELNPCVALRFKRVFKAGRRRSASTSNTRGPCWASATAQLRLVVVFPSSRVALVTKMTFGMVVGSISRMQARNVRYASAACDCGCESMRMPLLAGFSPLAGFKRLGLIALHLGTQGGTEGCAFELIDRVNGLVEVLTEEGSRPTEQETTK